MACRVQDKTIEDVLELLVIEEFEGMADAMSVLLNEAMRLDRSRHLGAGPRERVETRQDSREVIQQPAHYYLPAGCPDSPAGHHDRRFFNQ